MKTRKNVARIGSVETLEDRVVMSASRPQIVVTDVTNFFANYAATIPALVTSAQDTAATAQQSGTAADKAAAAAAASKLRGTIITDVNNLGTQLHKDLGAGADNSIRLSVTGATLPTDVNFSPGGTPAAGSLMNALLQVQNTSVAGLGGANGLNLAADLSIATSYAVALGHSVFPAAPFGSFTATHFSNILPLANQLANDRMIGGSGTAGQQQIAKDIAAIDNQTIKDVNGLGTTLVKQLGKSSAQGVGMVITGVNSTSDVTFVPTSRAAYGSLLATLQSLGSNTRLLSDPNVLIGITTLYAFI
jgi:hypothetical protein